LAVSLEDAEENPHLSVFVGYSVEVGMGHKFCEDFPFYETNWDTKVLAGNFGACHVFDEGLVFVVFQAKLVNVVVISKAHVILTLSSQSIISRTVNSRTAPIRAGIRAPAWISS
jgi:hypothetical protein